MISFWSYARPTMINQPQSTCCQSIEAIALVIKSIKAQRQFTNLKLGHPKTEEATNLYIVLQVAKEQYQKTIVKFLSKSSGLALEVISKEKIYNVLPRRQTSVKVPYHLLFYLLIYCFLHCIASCTQTSTELQKKIFISQLNVFKAFKKLFPHKHIFISWYSVYQSSILDFSLRDQLNYSNKFSK